MKKRRIIAFICCFALILPMFSLGVTVEAAGGSGGSVIYSENFDGKITSDISYGKQWYTGPENYIDYSVDNGALLVKNTVSNGKINFLEIVSADKLGTQKAYTISMDIMPISIPSASYGLGIGIHSAFPADASKTNDYDSYVFRDYNADGKLTFSRYLRQNGASKAAKDLMTKGTAGGFNTWYNVQLEVDGANVDVYFNGNKTAVSFTDSYDNKSPICLVSVGTSEFKVDNIKITSGIASEQQENVNYKDGDMIYSEKYDGKATADMPYGIKWYTGAENYLNFEVDDGALHVTTSKTNGNISFIELVSADKIGKLKKYTVKLDIMPISVGSASHGLGLAIHSAFPADSTQKNDYDSYVFRDYAGDGKLTFSRYLRDDGASKSAKDFMAKGTAGGFNTWYSVKLVVDGSKVSVYFNGSANPVTLTDSYDNNSPICLVSVGTSEFKVDNVQIWAGNGNPKITYKYGELIYSENFKGKSTSDIKYSTAWHTGSKNFAVYTVEKDVLHVKADTNGQINFVEIVPTEVMGSQTKYTVMLTIKPISIGSPSYGLGLGIHSAFPADASQTNDYDSYVFRDYAGDGKLTFSRYLRDDGKSQSAKDITPKGEAGSYNKWYRIRLEVDGKNVKAYFNGSKTPVEFTDSYNNKSPICLVSVGASEFEVSSIMVYAGVGLNPVTGDSILVISLLSGAAALYCLEKLRKIRFGKAQ